MSTQDVELKVVAGPRRGLQFLAEGRKMITVGRSKTADFHIVDGTMSRVHAVVREEDDGWYVVDQKSRNGVWVEGEQIDRLKLEHGCTFYLGKSTAVQFSVGQAERGQDEVEVRVRCTKCEEPIDVAKGMIRGVDGKPYHLPCRNVDHLIDGDLGDYRVLGAMAPRGVGFFFRANQPKLNRTVVLRVFDTPYTAKAGFRSDLLQEVRRVSKFLHPNLLQIFDYGEGRGTCFVAMEHFPGEALSAVLETRHYVKIRGAVSVALRLLEALQYAREQGSAMPWLKPQRVLVSARHEVKLDLFRAPNSPRIPRATLADAAYVPPEILNGESRGEDETAMVYSVGTLLYHMLAAIPPFEGTTIDEIAKQARSQSPPALRRINLKVSPALAGVVEAAIERESDERPQTLGAFLDELRQASGLSR